MSPASCRSPALALIVVAIAGLLGCGAQANPTPRGPVTDGDAGADVVDAPGAPDRVSLVLGGDCSEDGECGSGICADGVCCSTRCGVACQRCDQAGARGRCTQVPGGTPCGGNLCLSGSFVPQAICDQAGTCQEALPVSCAPSRCLDNRCVVACTRDDECEPPFVCRQGTCTKAGGGLACTNDTECASGFCAQGVCCNRACTAPCESCAQPAFRGVCQPLPGADAGADAGCAADAGSDAASGN